MRAKILKIYSSTNTVIHDQYGDDYSDVTRHIVSEHSDWEELTPEEFSNLQSWIHSLNHKRKDGYSYLLVTDSGMSVRRSIETMMGEEEERIKNLEKERKDRELKRREAEKNKKQNAALKLQKKLEKMTGAKVKLEKI